MRISSDFNKSSKVNDNIQRIGRLQDKQNSSYFTEHFKEQSGEKQREKLKEMLENIEEQGANLFKNNSVINLKRYKRLIGEFINEVVSNAYVFRPEIVSDRNGMQRLYANVDVINSKLDELMKDFISEEKESLNVIEKIGEIKGLLVDMIM